METEIKRDSSGKFIKGHSGNLSGRIKSDHSIRELARTYTTAAIKTLAEIASNPNSSDNSRVAACNSILDRGFGKPMQHQQNENINLGMTYVDYLEMLAKEEDEELKSVEVSYSVDN
ncbi:MAG: hypothetical protein GY775_01690 [Candidatus Scalindua sp.]|nr:hypothetical protein [Candidatus Scalindua sp.]